MIKDYKPAEKRNGTYYEVCFDNGVFDGYMFPCDEHGNVTLKNPEEKRNYIACINHPERYKRYNKVVSFYGAIYVPATGICKCGEKIRLHNQYKGACECPKCGNWYNLFGQEVVSPHNWAEDC